MYLPNSRHPLQVVVSQRNKVEDLKRHLVNLCQRPQSDFPAAALPFFEADGHFQARRE